MDGRAAPGMDHAGVIRSEVGAACGRGAPLVALSGGLDSTIVACMLPGRPDAVAVVSEDFVSSDLAYCQIAARGAGLRLEIVRASTSEMLDAAGSVVRALGRFGEIEVRNGIVMQIAASWAARAGHAEMATGDGADELFAGYGFMERMPEGELDAEVRRVASSMGHTSVLLGKELGVRVWSPFLERRVIDAAMRVPASLKVREVGGRRVGKWILRKAFEGTVPAAIAWRPKSPMQDGAGTSGLAGLIEALMAGSEFEERRREALERDGVLLRSRESAYYYSLYRRYCPMHEKAEGGCKFCGADAGGKRYCRTCGAYPI